ncbi:MAG: integrase arm-type DNA-binding domain-containing protein [Pseudomonadales bacterium]|jgi:integrase|nr:integrase arm-type DNA-binding domain-containing protein [Pseudomonadales bacterium]
MPKQTKPLTASEVENAKPQAKPYKLRDGGGLFLLVTPTGGKWWRLEYRRPTTGARNTLSLGTFPAVSLKQARQRREDARERLAEGIDPGEQRQATKDAGLERAANSLEVVTREYLAKKAIERTEGTARRALAWMEQHVFPHLGGRPIDEVEAPELLAVLQRLVKRGTLDSANRVRVELSGAFRYAIATGRAKRDPAYDLRDALPRHTKTHFAALTSPSEIADLLRAIESYQGDPLTLAALRLSPLLFQRPGELRGMEWSEVDLDAAEWRIPARRQKLKKAQKENPRTPDHVVFLSTQAVEILRELQPLSGGGRYVFPSRLTPARPMSENTVRNALRRMGYDNSQQTAHGFRHMASTRLNEMSLWNADAIEAALSHKMQGVRGVYAGKAQFLDERRKMMQAWADYLDVLRTGSNVVPIRRAI